MAFGQCRYFAYIRDVQQGIGGGLDIEQAGIVPDALFQIPCLLSLRHTPLDPEPFQFPLQLFVNLLEVLVSARRSLGRLAAPAAGPDRRRRPNTMIAATATPAAMSRPSRFEGLGPERPPGNGTRSPSPRTTMPAHAAGGEPLRMDARRDIARADATLSPCPRW